MKALKLFFIIYFIFSFNHLEASNDGIKSKINAIVLLTVNRFNQVTSPSYGLGMTEDELVSKWKKYYQ